MTTVSADKRTVTYPDLFVRAVKQAFPDNRELHAALDSGLAVLVGRILDAAGNNWPPTPEQVVLAFDRQDTADLYTWAKECKLARDLRRQWHDIVNSQRE